MARNFVRTFGSVKLTIIWLLEAFSVICQNSLEQEALVELKVEEDLATKLSIILPLGKYDDDDDHNDNKWMMRMRRATNNFPLSPCSCHPPLCRTQVHKIGSKAKDYANNLLATNEKYKLSCTELYSWGGTLEFSLSRSSLIFSDDDWKVFSWW